MPGFPSPRNGWTGFAEEEKRHEADTPALRELEKDLDLAIAVLGSVSITAVYRFMDMNQADRVSHRNVFKPDEVKALADLLAFVMGSAEEYGKHALYQQISEYLAGLPAEEPPQPKQDHNLLLPFAIALAIHTGETIRKKVMKKLEAVQEEESGQAPEVAAGQTTGLIGKQATGLSDKLKAEIVKILGITPDNPSYLDQVVGNTMHDRFRKGFDEVRKLFATEFPAWQWITTMDGRQRPAHGARHRNYYPSTRTFRDVRDIPEYDGHGCRCKTKIISKAQWNELQAQGATFAAN